jgi:hypothetical protein
MAVVAFGSEQNHLRHRFIRFCLVTALCWLKKTIELVRVMRFEIPIKVEKSLIELKVYMGEKK